MQLGSKDGVCNNHHGVGVRFKPGNSISCFSTHLLWYQAFCSSSVSQLFQFALTSFFLISTLFVFPNFSDLYTQRWVTPWGDFVPVHLPVFPQAPQLYCTAVKSHVSERSTISWTSWEVLLSGCPHFSLTHLFCFFCKRNSWHFLT